MSSLNKTEPDAKSRSGSDSAATGKEDSLPETSNQVFEKIQGMDRKFECSTSLTFIQIVDKFKEESESFELDTNLGTVRGRVCGKGEPVYFLNGAGITSELYTPIAWLLKDHYKCVLFDSPLYFPESYKKNDASLDDLTEIVKDIAELQNDQDISLFASSFGCMVALNALIKYPERFKRGILQGGYSHRDLSGTEKLFSRIGQHLPLKLGQVPLYKKIQTANHRHWLPLRDQGRWEFFLKKVSEIPVRTLSRQVRVISKSDLSDKISEIRQPVLIIRTEGDGELIGKYQEELEEKLANSKSEWIHTCGLIPFISRPHAIAKLIRNYV